MVEVLDVNWSFLSLPIWYRSPLEPHQTCALLTFCFCLHWVFVAASGLSLVVKLGGNFLLTALRLLFAVSSRIVEHRLYAHELQ